MGMLDGRVALVTGASRGIGEAIAMRFAAEGARVVCVARTLHEGDHPLDGSLERTVAAIREAGGEAEAVAANISEGDECSRVVAAAEQAFGPVDVLVNNAAANYFAPVAEIPERRWQRVFAVNVHAPFMLAQGVLPGMIERGGGAIVNIGSGGATGPGRGPYPTVSEGRSVLYGTTKAALERFTQGLAEEVEQHGIAVSCVSPSEAVRTPGALFHLEASGMGDQGAPVDYMVDATLLLATEPLERVSGLVTYDQRLLKEYGRLEDAKGTGVTRPGSGYSQI